MIKLHEVYNSDQQKYLSFVAHHTRTDSMAFNAEPTFQLQKLKFHRIQL